MDLLTEKRNRNVDKKGDSWKYLTRGKKCIFNEEIRKSYQEKDV